MPMQNPGFYPSVAWTPIILGATDNPVVNYNKQIGSYQLIGKWCTFEMTIITVSMTKTTLTDAMRVSLPFTAANKGIDVTLAAQSYNSTLVKAGANAVIAANTAYATLQQSNLGVLTDLTFGLLTGIGSLLTPITIKINGSYEIA